MKGARYFFIGIGGIGMSAIARFCLAGGAQVAGYDKTSSALTEQLEEEGMVITYRDDEQSIPESFRKMDTDLLVVRTPAVPIDSEITRYFEREGAKIQKRSEVLSSISNDKRCIAIAGTHGKTTTTSILGHILYQSSLGCTAFVGGVMKGYQTNVLIDHESPFVILEADEFDRSFHHLNPELAVVTSTDADHLDVYGSKVEFENAFGEFMDKVTAKVFAHHSVSNRLFNDKTESYGIEEGEIQATGIQVIAGRFHFNISSDGFEMENVSIAVPGRHNVLNTLAAISICVALGLSESEVRSGLATYKGVKRRFEYVIDEDDLVFIDDYAHHPSEIEACISSVRELYPNRKLTVLFQPHLYSRTNDFMSGFAESLALADEVVLVPIYGAREKPIPGVTSRALLEEIGVTNKVLCEKEELPALIAARDLEVLLTLGAGDIEREIPSILYELKKRLKPRLT